MTSASEAELKLIDSSSAEFARKELLQVVEINDSESFDADYDRVVEKAWELGFFHTLLPESMGGNALGCSALCTVLSNICREDASLGVIMLSTLAAYEMLLVTDNDALLKLMAETPHGATAFLVGFPLFLNPVEDALGLTARQEQGGYLLSGSLDYLVLAGLARKAVVPAAVAGESGFSYFLADLESPGTAISKPVEGLGISACPIADISLDQAPAFRCSMTDMGETAFNRVASRLSLGVAAMQTGIMKGAFRDALAYTGKRRQGGRNIRDWSEVKRILSGMAINIQLSELLLRQCCLAVETASNGWAADVAATLIRISEMAGKVTSDGIRVMGGVGYMKDFLQERRFRDARHLMSVFGSQQLKKLSFLERYIIKPTA